MTEEERWAEYERILRESTEYTGEIRREYHLFYDMGLSSMEVMVLVGDLEDQLGVHLEISKLKQVKTVEDLYLAACPEQAR